MAWPKATKSVSWDFGPFCANCCLTGQVESIKMLSSRNLHTIGACLCICAGPSVMWCYTMQHYAMQCVHNAAYRIDGCTSMCVCAFTSTYDEQSHIFYSMYVSMPIVQHTCSTNLGTWVTWVTHLRTCLDDSKCAHKGRGMHLYQPSKVSSRSVLLSSPPIHSSIPAFINGSRYQLPTHMHARYLTYLSIHPFVSASLCPSILYIRLLSI